jgi:hypothetical protein
MERFLLLLPSLKKKEKEGSVSSSHSNLQHRIGARFMTRYCSKKTEGSPTDNAEDRNRFKVSRERESVCGTEIVNAPDPFSLRYYNHF